MADGHAMLENGAPQEPKPWSTKKKCIIIGMIVAWVLIIMICAIAVGVSMERIRSASASENKSSNGVSGNQGSQAPTTGAPSFSPTTGRPTTLGPTKTPTTAFPTKKPTRAPTKWPTRAPTKFPTIKPPTPAPTSKAPTSNAPTTPDPTTGASTSKAPTSKAPTSKAPTSKAPTSNAPTTPPPITGTPTLSSNPATRFDIALSYVTELSSAEIAAFESAKARWESIITQDLASTVKIAANSSICGQPPPAQDILIDDILIFVEVKYMDGSSGVLGSAGPCGFIGSQVRVGKMTFDSADTADMARSGTLNSVILHEMGHVLGLGTQWQSRSLIDPVTVTTNIKYLGPNGNAGNVEIGGTGNATVEDTGGVGTKRGHWKETIYKNELMTGYISGTSQPLSKLTVRALIDLGYEGVDVSKADTFSIATTSGRRLRGGNSEATTTQKQGFHMGDDTYKGPIYYFEEGIPKPGREMEYRQFHEDMLRKRNQTRS